MDEAYRTRMLEKVRKTISEYENELPAGWTQTYHCLQEMRTLLEQPHIDQAAEVRYEELGRQLARDVANMN